MRPSPRDCGTCDAGADAKVKFWDLKKREDVHTSDAHTDQ
eukprot:COSAG01_NODE_62883_length_282_cov_1.120219_1_plen_39_part_10